MVGDFDLIVPQGIHKLLDFVVRESENDTKVYRAAFEIHADSFDEFHKTILARRVFIATYIANHFEIPVYVSESLYDIPPQ